MIPYGTRRWLPPICLVALIAAVWALPYRPDCDSMAWGDDPAIARIDSQCILLSHYANRLRIIGTTIKNAEFGLLIDELASNDYQRRWNDRLNFYGPEPSRWRMPSGTLPSIRVRSPTDMLPPRKRSRPASTGTGSGGRVSTTSFSWRGWRRIRTLPDSENWRQRQGTPTSEGF